MSYREPVPGAYAEIEWVVCACCKGFHQAVPDGSAQVVPDDSSTTETMSVGGSYSGVLETVGDRDWVKIDLVSGESYTIDLYGSGTSPLSDPYLRLYDPNTVLAGFNDDSGVGLNSRLTYTATTTGTFFVSAGAYADSRSGEYTIDVSPNVGPPPSGGVWTNDQIADQLTTGYWNGGTYAFNTGPNNTLSYNLTGLASDGAFLAREALKVWSDATGITFVETTGSAQITFDDNQSGAFASSSRSGGTLLSSSVNVSTSWVSNYGARLDGYAFQTYIHEIGHAIGLGHAGNYNGSADYGTDNLYANDSWQATVMSYFSQRENTSVSATYAFVVAPQVADVIAAQNLYGNNVTARNGDTTYGYNSTAGGVWDSFVTFSRNVSGAIVDGGGIDTLDFSDVSSDQLLDLREEAISNVDGNLGNLMIARSTVIENAIGGRGDDTLTGNDAGNSLSGQDGDDIINAGAGDDTVDGGDGDDTISGETGNDLLMGGDDNDLYLFDAGDGRDTIIDSGGSDEMHFGAGLLMDDLILAVQGSNILAGFYGRPDDVITMADAVTTPSGRTDVLEFANGFRLDLGGIVGGQNYYDGADAIDGRDHSDYTNGRGGNDSIEGNLGNDIIVAGSGDDTVNGGQGLDVLAGGSGADYFVFDVAIGASDADLILDFESGTDHIALDAAVYGLPVGSIAAGSLVVGAAASEADDRFIYDVSTARLLFDPDGNGAASALKIAEIAGGVSLSEGDFVIF